MFLKKEKRKLFKIFLSRKNNKKRKNLKYF